MSLADSLDEQANDEVPKTDKSISPSSYFAKAKEYLMNAGKFKKEGNVKLAYLNLKKYLVLVNDRMGKHPKIDDPEFVKEYTFNIEKAQKLESELYNLRKTLESQPKEEKANFFSLSNIFGGGDKKEDKLEKEKKKKKDLTKTEQVVDNIAQNEKVQETIGNGLGSLAKNEKVQGFVSDTFQEMSKDEKFQENLGNTIANSTDNQMIKGMAKNKDVQKVLAKTVSSTVGNKEFQKKTGEIIAKTVTNKEVQKKAGQAVVGIAKGGWSVAKFGAKLGWNLLTQENKDEKGGEKN